MLVITSMFAAGAGLGIGLRRGLRTSSLAAAAVSVAAALVAYIFLALIVGISVLFAIVLSILAGSSAAYIFSQRASGGGVATRLEKDRAGTPASGPIEMSPAISASHFPPGPTLEELEEQILRESGRDRESVDMTLLRSRLRELLHHVVMNMASNPNVGGTVKQQNDLRAVLNRSDFTTDLLRRQLSHLGTSGAAAWRILCRSDFEKISMAMAEAAKTGTFDVVDERTALAAAAMGIPRREVDLVQVKVPEDIDDTRLTLAAIMNSAGLGIGLWTTEDYRSLLRNLAQHVPVGGSEAKGLDEAGFVLVPARGADLVVAAFDGPQGSCLIAIPASRDEVWKGMFAGLTTSVGNGDMSGMTITEGFTQRALLDLFLSSRCIPGPQLKRDLDSLAG